MKKIRSVLLVTAFFCPYTYAQQLPSELQTPEVVSVNRMPMCASAFAFEIKDFGQQRNKETSNYFLSLNGDWKFNFFAFL